MSRVAVVGAGTMGRRLAVDFAAHGHHVVLGDVDAAARESAVAWIAGVLEERVRDGTCGRQDASDALARVTTVATLADLLSGADLVFENVPERLEIKRTLFHAMAPLLPPETLVVSNTSSLPGSLMADATGRGDRFINANFGHLGHRKVEVMGHPGTSEPTRRDVVRFLQGCGFVPIVLANEQFGYASNRLWRAIKKEVLRQLQAGITTPANVDRAWMLDWHVPMGPCAVMDRIGLDVVADIEQAYADHLGDPAEVAPPFLHAMIAAGHLGVKSGEGFYRYPHPAFQQPGFLGAPSAP